MADAEGWDSFIQAKWYYRGRKKPVRLLVIHCTVSGESGTGAEAVARYFARGERRASANGTVDSNSAVGSVHDGDTPFAAAGANHDGWHLELVGMPDQSLAQWLDPFSRAMFARAAPLVRAKAAKFDVPLRWLTVPQVRSGAAGLCTHHDISLAYPEVSTGHWDPGPSFPKGEFLSIVTGVPATAPQEDDMAEVIRTNKGTPNEQYAVTDWVQRRGVKSVEEALRVEKIVGRPIRDIPPADFDSIPVAK